MTTMSCHPTTTARQRYLALLGWSFACCSALRLLAYLPTVWAIHASGDSSQHSLWTWLVFLCSNLTMAAWLYEQAGQRLSRAVAVNLCNAGMCTLLVLQIVACRF